MEDGVDIGHCVGDVVWGEEVADEGFEIVGMVEVEEEGAGRVVGVNEGADCEVWCGEEEGDEMTALFAVCKSYEDDL